jgi:hypothetical protein
MEMYAFSVRVVYRKPGTPVSYAAAGVPDVRVRARFSVLRQQ